MYVCVCCAITERQVADCVACGRCSLAELRLRLEMNCRCGRCTPLLREYLERSAAAGGGEPGSHPGV